MGSTPSSQIPQGHGKVDSNTQTDITTFTERLKHKYEASQSTEAFDKECDVCLENGEAVGYCEQCRQLLCVKCCKQHEKISSTKFHRLVGTADIEDDGADVRKPLIDRICTPYAVTDFLGDVSCSAYCSKTGYIAFVSCTDDEKTLQFYSENGAFVKSVKLSKHDVFRSFIFNSTQDGNILVCYKPGSIQGPSSFMYSLSHVARKPKPECRMQINGDCYDLAEFDNGFAVSIRLVSGFSSPVWQIQMLEQNGEVKRQICYDKKKNVLFKDASVIATNMAETVLYEYVSDKLDESVIALNTGGDVVFKVKHGLKGAKNMTVDNDDNIYITNGGSVSRVDAGGHGSAVILKGTKDSDIKSMCFNLRKEHLVIFEGSQARMKSFSFIY